MRSTHQHDAEAVTLVDKEARRLKWMLANKRSDPSTPSTKIFLTNSRHSLSISCDTGSASHLLHPGPAVLARTRTRRLWAGTSSLTRICNDERR